MLNKRGQGLTISTLIMIVLGILVLVFLIFGFSMGWSNFWDKINIFGGEVNIDSVNMACNLACMQQGTYSFCTQERDLTIEKKKTTKGSCFDFATKNPSLGIENCNICSGTSSGCKVKDKPDVNCDGVAEETQKNTQSITQELDEVKSGAIAINLPDESIQIAYNKISNPNNLLDVGGTALA